ncbi:Transcriptional regulator, AbiEi antitoxin, Type IV TA system [Paraburkholderia diazotrophica]|uniref:Transcriptional regulator, AbiEi antitoxin, Type IV TA system n=1 Tax=Paraburkholderia diazotrophica TaxID=667676 RepID=A0A1H7E4S4_9BURK|nr:Transcriptional regulator, AbiEi antitoxin, Type IV TA system [Paraburkholderia diazotrophica]
MLWADRPSVMPDRVGEHMPYTLQTTRLFDASLPADTGLSPLPNRDPLLVESEPERALLELASDVGKRRAKGQSLEEAMSIAASLRNLRPKVLDTRLSHCTRVKVVKLVRDLGEASGFAWGKDLQRHVDRLGAGRRWTSSRKDGPRFTPKA